jgi:nucleoside-triphosphatase
MEKIYILSGAVHTGKTTQLMHWASTQKNIDGIFQPVIDEKRFIYHIASGSLIMLETEETSDVTTIGKYKFSNKIFEWANSILLDCMNKKLDWIVIDEIGPLELDGKALEPVVSLLISSRNKINAKLICVVRTEMLTKFIEHYQLNDQYEILHDIFRPIPNQSLG